jgi:hypothetical protein
MGEEPYMKIFIWRHSKKFSSWSMFNEPHIYKDNYMQAEVVVLASSKEEALDLLGKSDDKWDVEELNRIEPIIVTLDRPCVVSKLIYYG